MRRWRRVSGSIYLAALLVFVLGLGATYATYRVMLNTEMAARTARFRRYAEEISYAINARFAQYLAVLDGSAGLFAGSDDVSPDDWKEFATAITLQKNYPGIYSLQYLQLVTPAQLPGFVDKLRQAGVQHFRFRPGGRRNIYCPIVYAEPESIAGFARGFDVCSAESGATLLFSARDSGQDLLSAPMNLRDVNGTALRGVVVVRPLYRKHAPLNTIAERRRAVYGWVAATLPMQNVMHGAIPTGTAISLRIRDAEISGPDSLVYEESSMSTAATDPVSELVDFHADYSLALPVAGRRWVLGFRETTGILWIPVIMALAGVFITVPLSLLILNLGLTRSRALAMAETMTTALRENEALLSSMTNNISDGIYRGSLDRGLVYVNPALAKMFGFESPEAMKAVPGPIHYVRPERREQLRRLLERHGAYRNEEVEFRRQDGSVFYAINSAVAIRGPDQNILYFDGVISDISERKRAEQQVYRLAHYDTLTGLANRTLLRDRLEQALTDAKRRGERIAVMFLDLDHFKKVNDSLGHETGDRLLKAVSERLIECLRSNDSVSRQGGDEFILIVRQISDAESAARTAEKILQRVSGLYRVGPHELHITTSIGISLFPDDGNDYEILIRNADIAMYQAKEQGRSNYQFFTRQMTARAHERLSIENELRRALERGEFALHYQPQVSLQHGRIVGVEALLRWNSREHGMIPPATFIPIAEQSGLIVPIGEWVLREACAQIKAWQESGLGSIPVAVNLSAVQFHRRDIDRTISETLEDAGIDPALLELELTESTLMQETREIIELMKRLNDAGVRLAIDDFGTGYSSLSYLKRFRIDRLKIDQSFVRDIITDPDDAAITNAVIRLGHGLKVEVMAEGVETVEQMQFLRERGCDSMQGYYFSKPLPADAVARLFREGRTLEFGTSGISADHVGTDA
ncbi:MAG TPA: EAL domain-containing protein [Gammaproteobacteria bacterium]